MYTVLLLQGEFALLLSAGLEMGLKPGAGMDAQGMPHCYSPNVSFRKLFLPYMQINSGCSNINGNI